MGGEQRSSLHHVFSSCRVSALTSLSCRGGSLLSSTELPIRAEALQKLELMFMTISPLALQDICLLLPHLTHLGLVECCVTDSNSPEYELLPETLRYCFSACG